MLYSVGKDSSVMVRLAQKAFAPGPHPVPAAARRHRLQVRGDVRVPRPLRAARSAPSCVVFRNEDGHRRRRQPLRPRHPEVLRAAQDPGAARRRSSAATTTPRSAGPGATRRSRAPRSGSTRSATASASGIPRTSAPSCGTSTTATVEPGENIRVFPLSNWTELDVWLYIYKENIPIVPMYFAARARGGGARRAAHPARGQPDARAPAGREAASGSCAASARSAASRAPAPSRSTRDHAAR